MSMGRKMFAFGGCLLNVYIKNISELVHDKVSSFEIEFDRNDFLSRDDIGNIERKLKHSQYMFDKNDAQSVRICQAANHDSVLLL